MIFKKHKGIVWRFFSDSYIYFSILLFSSFLLLFIGEIALDPLRIAQHQYQVKKFVESNWLTLSKAYNDLKKEDVIALLNEARSSAVEYQYSPWVQFSMPIIKSRFLNTNGLRRSNGNDEEGGSWATNMPDKKHFDVYFFGSSHMFGYALPDNKTIPAKFEKIAPKKLNVRAFNFGVPYYFSRQETLLFEGLIRRGEKPDVAIFFDGLNDAVFANASFSREPFFTPQLRRRMNIPLDIKSYLLSTNLLKSLHLMGLVPSTGSLTHTYFSPPQNIPIEKVADTILNNYFENLQFTKLLCDSYKIKCYFFWQPHPMYYHNHNDTVSGKSSLLSEIIYKRIKKMNNKPAEFIDLSDLLATYNGQPFVDEFHYSGLFNEYIAQKMLSHLNP